MKKQRLVIGILVVLVLGLSIALGRMSDKLDNTELQRDAALKEKEALTVELWNTREQLRISNDQLYQIEMRNEGMEYQEGAE
ncbi:hypothetical protein [Bacillus licheniformis]|uniref:hypothetical protein n=1 Tax=Bacillus licheniformis TaxID=1402 RepID=UPI000B8B3591|nr:hypothetical protein [Bacillus licheniformis]MED0689939.1 hypothetical protein [Bacillus licheniformis]MED0713603.1 hypothetical protein [Bacillus licheniformis]MED0789280.1 hypothetical protein [Bacillus licheniformis]TWM10470.1 hypothetical protein CHCC15091_0967 [Bacillus licheniformis]WIW99362.1 hypothetical protein QQ984_03520 [Bacillus licheniformis]